MPKIRQSDIYNNSISFSRYATVSFTSTASELQGNVTASTYALGLSTGMTTNQPVGVKEFGSSSVAGWAEQQDWSLYNVAYTTIIPVPVIIAGIVSQSIGTTSISIGDLVAIYGTGAWSAGGNLSSVKYFMSGMGSKNAALITAGAAGGGDGTVTELFNGSMWSISTALAVAKHSCASVGTQNAGLIAGGITNGSVVTNSTELFNGITWSSGGTLSVARSDMASAGSQNAGLVAGGVVTLASTQTELFNGSTWSTSGGLSAIRAWPAGAGSQNAALVTGGSASSVTFNSTELFNGSTWSLSGLLSLSRHEITGLGTQNSALVAGGSTNVNANNPSNVTELFNGSAWSTSGTLSTPKQSASGLGAQNAGLIAGGRTASGSGTNITEIHLQTNYKKLTYQDARCAKNIGIATDITSTTCNVKIYGYVSSINVTPSNALYTVAANWVNNYLVLSRFGANVSISNNPTSIVAKSLLEADDLIVGQTLSATQTFVFGNSLFPLDDISRW